MQAAADLEQKATRRHVLRTEAWLAQNGSECHVIDCKKASVQAQVSTPQPLLRKGFLLQGIREMAPFSDLSAACWLEGCLEWLSGDDLGKCRALAHWEQHGKQGFLSNQCTGDIFAYTLDLMQRYYVCSCNLPDCVMGLTPGSA